MLSTYFVSYLDNEGDLCHVHVEAFDNEDAKLQVRREYWNVDEIIQVTDERN
jgi:hypothetical protein